MKISEIVEKDFIEYRNSFDNKDELISYMLDLCNKSGKIKDFETAKNDVFEREKVMSTGVGKGIALPHAKTASIEKSVGGIVILKEELDFDSMDDKPVNVAFMLLSKNNNVGWHLKMLSKISRLLNNDSIRNQLIESNSPEGAFEIIKKFDDSY